MIVCFGLRGLTYVSNELCFVLSLLCLFQLGLYQQGVPFTFSTQSRHIRGGKYL